MNMSKILEHYEKLEKAVSKLPKPLQQPILNELNPLKDLFLRQRPPRVLLLGDPAVSRDALVSALFGAPVVSESGAEDAGIRWEEFDNAGQGRLRVLDGRIPHPVDLVRGVLAGEKADLILCVGAEETSMEELVPHLDQATKVVDPSDKAALIGVLVTADVAHASEARQRFHGMLHERIELATHLVRTLAVRFDVRFRLDGTIDVERDFREHINRLADVMTQEVPLQAKLELARLSGVRKVQSEIATIVVRSFTAICGAIGAQPIPLADFPILTSLQVMMVASVIYISGQRLSLSLGAKFMLTLGANFGIGLACREGARAAVKLLPGWGNAVSGAVAGAATYAIGRSAIAYYIEKVSLQTARRVFKRHKKEKAPLLIEDQHEE
jgi:uncharacterized protein (DUF697 family)